MPNFFSGSVIISHAVQLIKSVIWVPCPLRVMKGNTDRKGIKKDILEYSKMFISCFPSGNLKHESYSAPNALEISAKSLSLISLYHQTIVQNQS